jgi:pimeloyl-ACP methyl ester carboxylesterase
MSRRVVSERSVDLTAGEFSYLEAGDGPPLVFLHALGRGASDWLHVMETLQADWRCIALDQRGHGRSVHTNEYGFELLERDFREFVDTLQLASFSIIAHSMGGVVGLLFAERTPERVESLVLEDTTAPMERHEYPKVPAEPPEPVDYDWRVRRQIFEELNSPDPAWWGDIPEVTSRTLLIAGRPGDRDLEETAEQLPHVRVVTIEAGHWIHESEPKRFLEVVQGFLPQSPETVPPAE